MSSDHVVFYITGQYCNKLLLVVIFKFILVLAHAFDMNDLRVSFSEEIQIKGYPYHR